jgi:hypothetical protein
MKKLVFVLAIAVVFLGVMAAPAMAKPHMDKPILKFTTGLQSDIPIKGTLHSGFHMTVGGVPGTFHDLTLVDTLATPALKDGLYPFYLDGHKRYQKATLSAYFAAKGWPAEYLAQIDAQIAGTSPFFYLKAEGGVYTLVDGFSYALSAGTDIRTLRIDDDYPAGCYVYTGKLEGDNGAHRYIAVKLTVAKPRLTFTTGLASDGTPIPGTLATGFALTLGGQAGTLHEITLVDPSAAPVALKDGMYPFYLHSHGMQKHILWDYFSGKGWPADYLKQIHREIAGGSPFFYLKAEGGVYTLVDGFSYKMFGTDTQTLRIDDDYPVGTYMYKGHLKAVDNSLVQINVRLTVAR